METGEAAPNRERGRGGETIRERKSAHAQMDGAICFAINREIGQYTHSRRYITNEGWRLL